MENAENEDPATLLNDHLQGRREAGDQLVSMLYRELRALAADLFKKERASHTLQPTALIHEAYLRLVQLDRMEWRSQAHFKALAVLTMRRVLADHGSSRRAHKRGGRWLRVTLDEWGIPGAAVTVDVGLDEIQDAVDTLKRRHERCGRVAELRMFGDLSLGEIAEALEVSARTVAYDWRLARAWLSDRLRDLEASS